MLVPSPSGILTIPTGSLYLSYTRSVAQSLIKYMSMATISRKGCIVKLQGNIYPWASPRSKMTSISLYCLYWLVRISALVKQFFMFQYLKNDYWKPRTLTLRTFTPLLPRFFVWRCPCHQQCFGRGGHICQTGDLRCGGTQHLQDADPEGDCREILWVTKA